MAVLESQIVPTPSFVPLENSELTTKQNLFVHYYLQTKNGRKSAELAGYSGDEATLRAIASENLTKPLIRSAIETYYKSRLLSADGVLAELSDIASAPWKDFLEVKLDPATNQVIDAKLRLADKIKASELLGKFYKIFAEKIEVEDTTERDPAMCVMSAINGVRAKNNEPLMDYPEAQKLIEAGMQRKLKAVS